MPIYWFYSLLSNYESNSTTDSHLLFFYFKLFIKGGNSDNFIPASFISSVPLSEKDLKAVLNFSKPEFFFSKFKTAS